MNNIGSILSDYERDQPRRASGGIYALSGFNYQLRLYIAQLAESLTATSHELEPAGRVFLEALSDLAIQQHDHLICIQAKRSLTKANLKDAAAEILAIDSFFEQRYPELRPQVRFHLVASKGDSSVAWSDLPRSHPSHPTVELLLAQNRLEQPRIEPDPGWRAITAVWNHLKAPYDFVRFALDRALTRINTPEDAQRVRDDICERFARDRKPSLIAGQLLVPEDFSSKVDPSKSLEIGREITLARVRDKQYMPRQHRRDMLYERLFERFEQSRQDLKPAVNTLWISGRSGAGKSVLLLQIVERLVTEGRRVLWLGGHAEWLEPALRAFVDAPEDLRPEFIAIDDLYDRDARARIDLEFLGAFIDEAGGQLWPMLVTCGPGEFADAFEEDSRYRGFELYRETLQAVSVEESHEIAEWYRRRTGREPAIGSAFEQTKEPDGGLFISLAVELAHGDLREFSQKFAARIRLNNLDTALCLPLALNRLYLKAPYNWLSDTDREKLTTLNIEGDFKLLEPGQDGQVVRLTHPHLGDALYRALRRPANSQSYANDLVKVFERALNEKNGLLVSQLLRLFSSAGQGLTAERLAIVDEKHLAEGCVSAMRSNKDQSGWDANTIADVSTSLACWASKRPELEGCLGRDVFETAVRSLDVAFKVWTSCWSRLQLCRPGSVVLQEWAIENLPKDAFITHPRWSLIWEQCLKSSENSGYFRDLGLVWLQRKSRKSDWHFVWKKLLPPVADAKWDSDPALLIGLQRLKTEKDGPDWAYVLQDLYNLTKGSSIHAFEVATLGQRWLVGRENRIEWSYVWRNLVNKSESIPESITRSLLEYGSAWIVDKEDHRGWSYVWRGLLENLDAYPEFLQRLTLLRTGHNWLMGREGCLDWGFVWIKLLDNSEHLVSTVSFVELSEQGYRWLLGREDRFEWTFVWAALMKVAERLPDSIPVSELIGLGSSWLTGRRDRKEFVYVWRPLFENRLSLANSLELTNLLAEGYWWLAGKEEEYDWPFVWQIIVENNEQLPESISLSCVLEAGYSWLLMDHGRHGWSYIWRDLLQRNELLPETISTNSLLTLGHSWVAGQESCEGWGYVCEQLLEYGYNDSEFLDIAAHWLNRTSSEPPWIITVVKFLVVSPFHPSASGFASTLIQRVIDRPNSHLWLKIESLVEALFKLGSTVDPQIRSFCEEFFVRRFASAWTVALECVESKTAIKGKVAFKKGSHISVELEIGLLGFWVNKPDNIPAEIGDERDFYIMSLQPERDLIRVSHVSLQRIDFDITYDGQVIGHSEFGLFVTVEDNPGMIHHSRCHDFQKLLLKYPKGSHIRVQAFQKSDKGLSLIYVGEQAGQAVIRALVCPGDQFEGRVKSVMNYGLFIYLDEFNEGLLHRSNLPPNFQSELRFSEGKVVSVEVFDVKEDGKILLVLRL
ncbi:S1 RNA-binding domain-containing protein [Pseudomonas fluorescens]|uniref:S1 RNA-binding domain-containing protein n=1 Tax=Pseudomonas fluorescens TaxID=294 RepID=UPI00178489F9|nr:S1 RNA-binding domain-containing protein [Pseudomonas fluorescens]MBD8098095.1 S1 RNA-binding domain-containing protein [Pseudomonas fluorescens]MBD8775886.1 S1 RNA-binding domain-containing protein [Pseudomonas fluorescens]MBD8779115.1 S1 RNA-binding domain-containing protein [Pseudomonas fluorescens]MBD8795645.1 S1 RNA-binding domain-containing protein [Pseudomonas fluorescens]